MKDEKTQWTVPTKLKIYYSIFNGWKAGSLIFILPVYKGYNIVNYHVDGSECLGWSLLSIPVLLYWQCSFQSSFHFIFSTSDGSLINHHLQVSFILCQYKLSNRYTIYLSISQQIIQIHIFSLSRTATVSLSEKNLRCTLLARTMLAVCLHFHPVMLQLRHLEYLLWIVWFLMSSFLLSNNRKCERQ